jgi:PBP1b-binding outer membrane lipoprotein LpoB
MKILIFMILFLGLLSGCSYTRFTSNQKDVLIEGIDVDQSIQVAKCAMEKTNSRGKAKPQTLGFWVLRAQQLNAPQAQEISTIYFEHIDSVTRSFHIWHYTWAIADMYRLGNDEVKGALMDAYSDAVIRGIENGRKTFVDGDKLMLGFFHGGGFAAARKHLVVPGNRRFNQSAKEYLEKNKCKNAI